MSFAREVDWLAAHLERQAWCTKFDVAAHTAFLDALRYHPRAWHKLGCGVAMFFKEAKPNGYPLVKIRHLDLSEDDFDWRKALAWKYRSERNRWLDNEDAYRAFRAAIEPQIEAFRKRQQLTAVLQRHPGECFCKIEKRWFPETECQVDHIFPQTFSVLLAGFIAHHDIKLDQVETKSAYPRFGRVLVHSGLKGAWSVYHAERARLRVLSTRANISQAHKAPRITSLLDPLVNFK